MSMEVSWNSSTMSTNNTKLNWNCFVTMHYLIPFKSLDQIRSNKFLCGSRFHRDCKYCRIATDSFSLNIERMRLRVQIVGNAQKDLEKTRSPFAKETDRSSWIFSWTEVLVNVWIKSRLNFMCRKIVCRNKFMLASAWYRIKIKFCFWQTKTKSYTICVTQYIYVSYHFKPTCSMSTIVLLELRSLLTSASFLG